MADQVALVAETRPGSGKGEARSLRRAGRVPAVAYGAGLEATPIHVDALDLLHALSTEAGENAVIKLTVDGVDHLTLTREIHRHPVKRNVLHLDFLAIDTSKKQRFEVPLHVEGEIEGAVINQTLNYLTIEVLPLEAPDAITVDVSGFEVGDVLRAGEITLPAGVDLLDDPERTAVSITLPELEIEEEPEEEEGLLLEGEELAEGEEPAAGAEGEGEEPAEGKSDRE